MNRIVSILIFVTAICFIKQDAYCQWEKCSEELPDTQPNYWWINTNNSNLIAWNWSDKVYISNNNGNNWNLINNGLEGCEVTTIESKKDIIYAGTTNLGIYVSTDKGENWVQRNNGLTDSTISTLTITGDYLFAGATSTYQGVYRSTDNGKSWEPKSNGIKDKSNIMKMSSNENFIFAATNPEGMYKSSDYGKSWIIKNSGLPKETNFNDITAFKNIIITATIFPTGLFLSTDNGESWEDISSVLPLTTDRYVSSIEIYDGHIFVGLRNNIHIPFNSVGIYYSSDKGNTWKHLGLQDKDIFSVCINNKYVFASTRKEGTFRTALDRIITDVVDGVQVPSNTNIKIYKLENEIYVDYFSKKGIDRIKIYDLLGNSIYSKNVNNSIGKHKIIIDRNLFKSGLYFFTLKTGSKIYKGKFVITR